MNSFGRLSAAAFMRCTFSPAHRRVGDSLLHPGIAARRAIFLRHYSVSSPMKKAASQVVDDLSKYYHIEANNRAREDATQLTVSGPDVDGILASMTVALAVGGCSLVELHAAKSADSSFARIEEDKKHIKDIFLVVDRNTGEAFQDDQLLPLAQTVLEALKTPMATVGGSNPASEDIIRSLTAAPYDENITIIPSS